ncbi:mechanosensitive ion channel family protein [Alicyclobacillus cycloheptanicus]|uniref:Small conductance mechanosensitive channel n=1 Tax=Alicyclobacillus cycloheptanicus TaxID=1457 RepID=A0ABT9XJ39_9BACL|nr:mechanosensitive ion channel family protein [Alicyclobacillus cycloheptanicus]MDQ0190327.1 small conductance mechanosensitive channel [Alicyclobacillus cycloheptanicus]WDM00029.1 mechanosensitive ion channel family protein [Alicyclobacillus cycloheptanicus]
MHYVNQNVTGLEHAAWDAVKIILLFVAAQIIIRVLYRLCNRLLQIRTRIDERRRNTLAALFQNVARYTVYFILVLTILPIFGVHIEALLAGAGVAGIAIAFGAQNLLKDIFNGLFILFEDQYGVGDYVLINGSVGSTTGISGQVRTIGVRITVIKVWTGELVFIPNGQIIQVTNYSKENSIAVVDVDVGKTANTSQAIDIMQRIMEQLKRENPNIVGPIASLGIQAVTDTGFTLRATAECAPYTQFGVVREAQQRIHQAFLDHGVELPAQKVVYVPDTGAPPTA